MDHSYGQFCTIARAAEALCERWTPLVVRELLCGSKRFNDLHRGVPRMSSSLLARRLRHLENIGVIRRAACGKVWEYSLTDAGEELRPIIIALGNWGARWADRAVREDELDAGLLMWEMRRAIAPSILWPGAVIQCSFTDARLGERNWFLLLERAAVVLTQETPPCPPTLLVRASVRGLTAVWRGESTAGQAIASGTLAVEGSGDLAQLLWKALETGPSLARANRPA